jgi:hypothetical protein
MGQDQLLNGAEIVLEHRYSEEMNISLRHDLPPDVRLIVGVGW